MESISKGIGPDAGKVSNIVGLEQALSLLQSAIEILDHEGEMVAAAQIEWAMAHVRQSLKAASPH